MAASEDEKTAVTTLYHHLYTRKGILAWTLHLSMSFLTIIIKKVFSLKQVEQRITLSYSFYLKEILDTSLE